MFIFNLIMMLAEDTMVCPSHDIKDRRFKQYVCDGTGIDTFMYDSLIKEYWG